MQPMGLLPRVVKGLLIINVIVFLVDLFTQGAWIQHYFALDSYRIIHDYQIWRFATYMFVHALNPPFFHILFNMLMLWMFGVPLVQIMGEKKFLGFYLGAGIFSALCSLLFYSLTGKMSPIIGASGALFALMFAFAKYFPTQQFQMFFVFSVEARYAVLIIGAIEILLMVSNDGIAHITHLGGALFAFIFLRYESVGENMLWKFQHRKETSLHKAVQKSKVVVQEAMIDIDPILKKISEFGMGALTADEKEKLDKASEIKRRQKNKIISFEEYRKRQ